jgi:para-nitrobenzyl esterase
MRHASRTPVTVAVSVAIAVATIALVRGQQMKTADRPTVTVESGQVRGVVKDTIASFLGVPYAAPPVGSLRWRASQAPAKWQGVRDAQNFGNDCVQHRQYDMPQSEDCLFLNVWAPAGAPGTTARLPVMFWIYGGGLSYGSAAWPWYDGAAFARQGVVLVSINYRLARFGFFAHPALSAEDKNAVVGNYGFMDQIAALQWVQRNIAAFGGNSSDVTIFGESAGGRSVNALLVSPLSKGLFQKAIIESGAGRTGMRHIRESRPGFGASAESMGVEFAKSAGLTNATAEQLRALPADIVRGPVGATPPAFSNAMIDGRLIVEDFADSYKKGAQHQMPLVIGANSAEFGTGAAPDPEVFFKSLGSIKDKAVALYDGYGTKEARYIAMEMTSDMGMVNGTRWVAQLIARAGKPVFLYHFGYVSQAGRSTIPGARHASELVYVFDTPGSRTTRAQPPTAVADADRKVAKQMNAYWVNFAKTGDPNGTGLPRWSAYSATNDNVLEFTMNDGPIERQHFKGNKMAFWDGVYDTGFKPTR